MTETNPAPETGRKNDAEYSANYYNKQKESGGFTLSTRLAPDWADKFNAIKEEWGFDNNADVTRAMIEHCFNNRTDISQ